MLGAKEAINIRDYVNSYLFEGKSVLSIEDVALMHPLPGAIDPENMHIHSFTVLGLQWGTQTILVWVQFTEHGLQVRQAKIQYW